MEDFFREKGIIQICDEADEIYDMLEKYSNVNYETLFVFRDDIKNTINKYKNHKGKKHILLLSKKNEIINNIVHLKNLNNIYVISEHKKIFLESYNISSIIIEHYNNNINIIKYNDINFNNDFWKNKFDIILKYNDDDISQYNYKFIVNLFANNNFINYHNVYDFKFDDNSNIFIYIDLTCDILNYCNIEKMIYLFLFAHQIYNCDVCKIITDNKKDFIIQDNIKVNNNHIYSCKSKFYNNYDENIYFCVINMQIYKNIIVEYETKHQNSVVLEKEILPRNLLFNIKKFMFDSEENNLQNYHYDFKFINNNIISLTITKYQEEEYDYQKDLFIEFNINGKFYKIDLKKYMQDNFGKITLFFRLENNNIEFIEHIKYDFNIIQTSYNTTLTQSRFYTICSLLSYMPNIKYIFYDDDDSLNFILNFYPSLIDIYKKMIIGSFKADLFRYLYLFTFGGIYMDCKFILCNDISNILEKNICYCSDINEGFIYNAFMYIKNKKNDIIYEYTKHFIYNIANSFYGKCELSITGPGLLKNYITKKDIFLNNVYLNKYKIHFKKGSEYHYSFICDKNKIVVIKCGYIGYRNNNDFGPKEHHRYYGWTNKSLYNENIIVEKVDSIDEVSNKYKFYL